MDLVTVTGVPEPTFGLAGSGLAVAALTALRRRARRSLAIALLAQVSPQILLGHLGLFF